MRFQTPYRYTDRETKALYVWLKYQSILRGSRILDVGGDQGFLKGHLESGTHYWSIDAAQGADQAVDLDLGALPFEDRSYDCVLCLDVLEHVDNIHGLFDELCRVSSAYVVISLPNAWAVFWGMLRRGEYRPGMATKFYGLPVDPPSDRHKWFFNDDEARRFIEHRAQRCGMRVLQIDNGSEGTNDRGLRGLIRRIALAALVDSTIATRNLYRGTVWAVLERDDLA